MKYPLTWLLAVLAAVPVTASAEEVTLDAVVVTGTKEIESTDSTVGVSDIDEEALAAQRATTSDTARLLQDVPGMSTSGAGGISSLPVIRGLADDRIRIQVDGAGLMPACPNHMNSPLSYIDPTKVGSITVFAGITPVSVGGDSIGGSIQVESAAPEFARVDEDAYVKGELGSFFRSNGNARGYNLGATWVGHDVNISYSGSSAQSNNYKAGGNFKAAEPGTEGGSVIPGDEVGSSAYDGVINHSLGIALRHENHLLQLDISQQNVDFEGFPNQRMDMTFNKNTVLRLRYLGQYEWGDLESNIYNQDTRHKMNMGPDRYTYGTGMPMDSESTNRGGLLQANIILSDRDILRLGAEYQFYTLNDYWPAVGGTMGPNTFWNIDFGQRDRFGAFAEWEARWNPKWLTQFGVRSDTVKTNAAAVQGYDNSLAGLWGNDAAAFNASDRKHTNYNWDLTALTRYTPDNRQTYEWGYARKSRSPNVYQRYPWSSNAMAALMNNLVGDGNGYIGNVDLDPEVAHTLSATGNWSDAANKLWSFQASAYYTYIQDYIDAQRCDFSQCSDDNVNTTTNFVLLQYVNQSAELYGIDLSGEKLLANTDDYGSFSATGLLNYIRGKNRATGDNLYNMMPLNVKLAAVHHLGSWTNSAEVQAVAAKDRVSHVRNEVSTDSYELFNLRSNYRWKNVRLDFAIENVFDRLYAMPLGGAYVGQGPS
ncbi:MAG: TonB-dependent receptor plug domain-containing protein, partial [Gammaproteobacteria bacterium]|nr:TonB-dependent receptor plug domain-containing protein [Gammaproteobacteria bacterium]